jgi:hypothetical protein
MTDKPSDGIPTGWEPKKDIDHLTVCATCGKRYDMRKLDEVLAHVHGGKIEMIEAFRPPRRRM